MMVRLGLVLMVALFAIVNLGCAGFAARIRQVMAAFDNSAADKPDGHGRPDRTFTVTATDAAAEVSMAERRAPITGATSSSYTTPATTSSDSGVQFTVVVSNIIGTAASSAATLTVNGAPLAPSVVTQPTSQASWQARSPPSLWQRQAPHR